MIAAWTVLALPNLTSRSIISSVTCCLSTLLRKNNTIENEMEWSAGLWSGTTRKIQWILNWRPIIYMRISSVDRKLTTRSINCEQLLCFSNGIFCWRIIRTYFKLHQTSRFDWHGWFRWKNVPFNYLEVENQYNFPLKSEILIHSDHSYISLNN